MGDPATFRTLSAALTGFESDELDPTVASEYEARIAHGFPDTPLNKQRKRAYRDVLEAFTAIAGNADLKTAVRQMLDANPSFSPVISQIVLLWYTAQFTRDDGSIDGPETENQYKSSLVWRAIGAVPLGYSDLPHGYWTVPPTPLPKM